MFNPVFFALVAHLAGIHIYGTSPSSDSEERNIYPGIIFASGICILIAHCRAFENMFCRPALWPFQFIFKFLASAYVLETLQVSMLIPFENMVLKRIPALAESMEKECAESDSLMTCAIYRLLNVVVIVSANNTFLTLLAVAFLACSLHMTNIIDVRILRCGPRRLIALLVQYLLNCVGIQSLVCEEDVMKNCRPTGNGCGVGGGGVGSGAGSPQRPIPAAPCRHPRHHRAQEARVTLTHRWTQSQGSGTFGVANRCTTTNTTSASSAHHMNQATI